MNLTLVDMSQISAKHDYIACIQAICRSSYSVAFLAMGKRADLTDDKKQSIRALLQVKTLSNIEIAVQEGVSKCTVIRIKRKMEQGTLLMNGRVKKYG